jgi:hypothetical protein
MFAALRTLMLRYKLASALSIATLVVMVGVTAAAAISSSHPAPLNDASTCTQWSAAPQSVRATYSQKYLNEHGAIGFGVNDAGTVEARMSAACEHAAYLGESDDLALLAAIEHHY